MRRASLALLALAGCWPPSGGSGVAGVGSAGAAGAGSAGAAAAVSSAARGPDLSFVKPGQRWVYRLQGGAVELVYTVRDVAAGLVRYEAGTVLDAAGARTRAGPGQPQEYRWAPSPQPRRLEGRRERLVVPGPDGASVTLSCVVLESGSTRTWTAVVGHEPVFPLVVRVAHGDVVERELVRVE